MLQATPPAQAIHQSRSALIRSSAAVVLVGIAGIAIGSMKAIIIGAYVHDFGLSAPTAGYALSVEMVAATIGTIISTLFIGRLALAVALCAIFVGDVGTGLSSGLTSVLACQVVAGLGHGFAIGRMGAGIASSAQPHRLSGVYTTAYLILSSLTAMALPDLRGALGGHALFFMLALTGPMALLAVRWFPVVQKSRRAKQRAAGEGPSLALVLVVCVTMLLWYISIGGYWPYMAQLGEQAGVSFDARARILGSANLFGLLGASLSILAGDRFGSLRPLAVFVGLQLTAMVLFMIGPRDLGTFTLSAWLYVFAWLGGFPFLLGLFANLDRTGRVSALLYVMGNTAYAIGPAGAGLLIRSGATEAIGLARLQGVAFVLLLVSGAMLIGLGARAPKANTPT